MENRDNRNNNYNGNNQPYNNNDNNYNNANRDQNNYYNGANGNYNNLRDPYGNNNYNPNNGQYNDNNNFNYGNNYQNYNNPYQQNYNPNDNPYSLDNLYFNKTDFREKLVNMSFAERETFINSLPEDFKASNRMPSMKSKTLLMIITLVGAFFPLILVDRLYAGRFLTGIIKFILPISIIIWAIIAVASAKANLNPEFPSILFIVSIIAIVLTVIVVITWVWVDVVIILTGKMKDQFGRKIDT